MPRQRQPAVYIMASQRNGTRCIGVTGNLVQRAAQHRTATGEGFTAQHNCTIEAINPQWLDLYNDIL